MQSGKIMPVIRQFLSSQVQAKRSPDSSSEKGNQNGRQEREPSHDEALAAMELLAQQEEFQKQGLQAELKIQEEKLVIVVSDRSGARLKVIRGTEILRILGAAALSCDQASLGRILDRRV